MKTLPAILIGLMACLAIGITTAQGQQYSLQDLGVVKDMEYSVPAAINSQGYVAGTAYKGGDMRLPLRLPSKIHGGRRRPQQPRIRH